MLLTDLPKILFLNDFPPSNLGGGSVLAFRLLEEYPPEKLVVFCNSQYGQEAPKDGRLNCPYYIFPATSRTGPLGIGRIKILVDCIMLPFLSVIAVYFIWRHKIKLIYSVTHGYFFLAATLAAKITGKPLVLAVHDDWIYMCCSGAFPFRKTLKKIHHAALGWALRSARRVYANGPFLQQWVLDEFFIHAALQGPAVLIKKPLEISKSNHGSVQCLKIIYLGSFLGAVHDCLEALRETLQRGLLESMGIKKWQCILYTNFPKEDETLRARWKSDNILIRNWVNQADIQKVLAEADILFLPQSFKEHEKNFVQTSLPAKVGDYLAAGKPIIVLAPDYAVVSRYAVAEGFARVVNSIDYTELAKAFAHCVSSSEEWQLMREKAKCLFLKNHSLSLQRIEFYKEVSNLSAELQV